MGFSRQIMEQWGSKTATPELRRRLEKAGDNWVRQKAHRVYIDLASGVLSTTEASGLVDNLYRIKVAQIDKAMSNGHPNATP
tara:strand:- start:3801 stop:4046 length:246 start_codon:yes stop_codon:yes gene_type:complete